MGMKDEKKISGEALQRTTSLMATALESAGEEQCQNREAAERLAGEMAVIAEIGRLISSTLDINAVYERFAAEARKLIPFDRLAVNVKHPHNDAVIIAYTSGSDVPLRMQEDPVPPAGTLTEEVLRTRTCLVLQPEGTPESIAGIVGRFPALSPSLQSGLLSFLCVPLIYRDKAVGVLHFRSKKTKVYTEQDLRLAERIGAQIAGAIANTQLFADLRRMGEEQCLNREAAERLAWETSVIAEIGRLISSTLDINEVYERFAVETQKLILFDSLTINLFNAQENTLCVAYVSGLDIAGRMPGDPLILEGSLSEDVIRTRTGLCIQPASIDEIIRQFPKLSIIFQTGLKSIMCVPMISRNEVIGVLHFRSKKQNAYTEKDLRLAERIGMQIAGAIANAQLYTDLKNTEKALLESEGRFRGLVEQAAVGVAEIEISTGRFFTVNRRLCKMVGRTEEEMLATNFQAITHPADSHLHEEKTARMLSGDIDHYSLEKRCLRKDRGIVWVNITVSPLWKPGEEPGHNMMVAEDITDRKRMEEALRDREQRYRELSIIDDLTQLYNSRHFYFQLKVELDRSNRYGHPLTLLLLDLDNFKHFNDTYGHVEGDQVLMRLGQVVKRCLRETDFAYRYGGEEFTILLPMTTSKDGAVTAERIRTEFKKETFSPLPGQDVHKTVSIGLAQYRLQEDMKGFVHRVDQLMYQGKKNGKDRVCCES